MSYERACELICAVNDRDQTAVTALFASLKRADVQNLALMLAAMVPEESHTPASVVKARTAYLECTDTAPDIAAWDYLVDTTASLFAIRITDLTGESRKHHITEARHIVCWAAHYILGLAYAEIGRRIGRDHTSVMSACQRVSSTPKLRAKANIVAAAIGAEEAA